MVASMNPARSTPRAARRLNDLFGRARRRLSRIGELLSSAGRVDRPEFEHLEQRQLLFALTITPDLIDPVTGVGTIRAYFGYAIPYLGPTSEPVEPMQDEEEEDFAAAIPGEIPTPAAVVPQTFTWPSGFTVRHNLPVGIYALSGMRLQAEDLILNPDGNNEIRVGIQAGGEFTFSFSEFNIPMEVFEITMRGNFNTNNFTVELISEGVVLDTLTGAELDAIGEFLPGGQQRRFTFLPPAGSSTIDQVRFIANPGTTGMVFAYDDLRTVLPGRPFDAIVEDRLFGVAVAFTGPLGATAEFFDLHGRPMIRTIAVGEPPNSPTTFLLIDPDGNGIPNFNDGIGRIQLSNVDQRSALTMWGGEVNASTTPPEDALFTEGLFYFRLPASLAGLLDDFEDAGFGYAARPADAVWDVTGLPENIGSLIIGSPLDRPLNNYNVPGLPPGQGTTVTSGFNRLNQGVFVTDGSNMGSVYLHALLFGSSRFDGFVNQIIVGSLMGSISVAGDLGYLVVGSDAGVWVDDEGVAPNGALAIATGSQVVVGRTLGEFIVVGRNLTNVTVIGDLDSPEVRPGRDILRYYEREHQTGLPMDATVRQVIANILNNNAATARNDFLGSFGDFFTRIEQAKTVGTTFGGNNTILTAEWVGSIGTAVQIHGSLGRRGPVMTQFDPSDVYGFAADGSQEILVELDALFAQGIYMRLVDPRGRTVAAPQFAAGTREVVTMRYMPEAPGVYYLVLQTTVTPAPSAVAHEYIVKISGMAPTTFGSYRIAASSGNIANTGLSNSLNVMSGSLGVLLTDTSILAGGGGVVDIQDQLNIGENQPDARGLRGGTISVSGNLYGVFAGWEINGAELNVGGNIGMIYTGMIPELFNDQMGNLRFSTINAGGSIGTIHIPGSIGTTQDPGVDRPWGEDPAQSVVIRTGLNPQLRGDIGFIYVASHVGGNSLVVHTSNNSVVGGFAVSQERLDDEGEPDFGIFGFGGLVNGVEFNLGANSDLRFFDAPRVDLYQVLDHTVTIPTTAQGLELTDDAGGKVTLRISGGDGTASGNVRLLPMNHNSSQGVAIGRITVDLSGGAVLNIESSGPINNQHVISIGRINIRGASDASAVSITGTAQVDVWQIVQEDGDSFNEIVNTTPRGDIVAIDMAGLNRVQIGSGNLGRTQVPAWGPDLIGPFLGIASSAGTSAVAGAIPLDPAAMTEWWNSNLYRPVDESRFSVPPRSWLDDVGSPIDPYLNGVIVRQGSLISVEVGGAVGDVIVAAGTIGNVIANFNLNTPAGEFHGIVGNIHALRISRVDIGDGLAPPGPGPLAKTGITATDNINLVLGTRVPGANIESNIIAANLQFEVDPAAFPTEGINRIELRGGGDFINAYIGATPLDDFWFSYLAPDDGAFSGTINQIVGNGANFLRSEVTALFLNSMVLTNGFYDASIVNVSQNVQRIEATGFRNSTIGGNALEHSESRITVASDLGILTTTGRLGDINDLHVEVHRRLGEVSARNITRARIDVDVELANLTTVQSLRSSEVTTGQLTSTTIGENIRSSVFMVAGPLQTLNVADSVTNSEFNVTGPDGRIGIITVANLLSGMVTSTGPIGTIRVTQGDMVASIRTSSSLHGNPGNINLLSAGRDLNIRTDIAGTINQLAAGRHIGNRAEPGIILTRGNIQSVNAPNGQLYSDLRVGGTVSSVAIGSVVHRPGNSILGAGSIIAFGRIENINIEGDFGGDIISYSGGIGVITINNGSFLPGAQIAAYDGTLTNLFINNGNLYGNVHADYNILAIRLNGSTDGTGVFGHVGINPNFSAGTPYSDTRSQHPPGVIANSSIQGPRITAGHNFGRLILTNGSMFETFVHAGRAIGTVEVNGNISNDHLTSSHGTVIAAGSSIFTVRAFGNVSDTMILAGVRDFGANNRPGGIGANADTVESGRLQTVDIRGNATNVIVSAGMDPGADGMYNTPDDLVVMGISYVREVLVGGTVNNVSVYADSPTLSASDGVELAGHNFVQRDPDLHAGGPVGVEIPSSAHGAAVFNFTSLNGESGTITFTGSGRAFWDQSTNRVVLVNTSLFTEILVTSSTGRLTDFAIVSNDNASMGRIQVDANLFGESRIVIDAYVIQVATGDLNDESTVRIGMNVRHINTGNVNGGSINALFWARDIRIDGNYGTTADFDEARIDALAANSITITGNNAALVNIERDLGSFVVSGAMERAQFRSGASVTTFTVGSLSETRVSVRDRLGTVTVNGNVHDTAIQAGGDLGHTVLPSPLTNNTTTGQIGSVVVDGNMTRSSIVAGLLRGPDGFFGTADDAAAPGLSTIGPVTIAGTVQGSNTNSQQYRISATGTIGAVTVSGQPGTNQGNFQIQTLSTQPAPISIVDLQSISDNQTWTTWIHFNQPMNVSTIGPALTVSEVRRDSENLLTKIPLVEGTDYTFTPYDAVNERIGVVFNRAITERNLDDATQAPGELPGPGIYRVHINADVLRATVVTARLAGDLGGFGNSSRDYSQDTIVGDAGDKLESEITEDELGRRIDFYGPLDLNLVMDNNYTPDGLPDPNVPYTVRGTIGDHPDHGTAVFRASSDADIYKVTLRAGQILRLGAMEGAARFTPRLLLNETGDVQFGITPDSVQLPSDPFTRFDFTQAEHFLIKQTGTYYVVISNHGLWDVPEIVPDVLPGGFTSGQYRFTLEVFDDGNSGFAADTNSGNGEQIVNAPNPIVFAGPSGVFGTGDDRSEVVIGDFVFRLDPGPDGIPGTADDIVIGTNGNGVVSQRIGNQLTTTVDAAIGPRGHSGVPNTVTPDVDVYHLNSGQPIAAGQLVTVRVKLSEIGADLGSFSPLTFFDYRGHVQFGIFDTTGAQAIDDALLVFSPTDFLPIAGEPGQIATQGQAGYGYDENGDFFITFITPGRIDGSPTDGASYAVYLQGVYNTDYQLEIVQVDAPDVTHALPRSRQNILIETKGGLIDWLEAGGITTELAPFAGGVLGFVGSMDNKSVDQYIVEGLLANLQSVFDSANVGVRISSNPNDFEFQDFSKVFITSTNDPVDVFSSNNFGYSQRSDPFNFDRNDEAVIFLPSLGTLGYSGSRNDVDNFILSLTGAVGRRIGELAGLRMTENDFLSDPRSIMSAGSVFGVPFLGGDYAFSDQNSPLSGSFDSIRNTSFFLGQQNSLAMLQRYLLPPI